MIIQSFYELTKHDITLSRIPRGDSGRITSIELSRNVPVSIGHPMSGYPQNLADERPRSRI